MTISVILPAYKEANNLKKLIPVLHKVLGNICREYEILIVDTESPLDDTEQVCQELHATYLRRENGNLYGNAIRTGISKAQYERTIIMDADGSHNPNDIKIFCDELKKENYDLIIGSRYTKGGNSDNNLILKAMSWTVNFVYRVIFNLNVKDVSDSFRMYDTQRLKTIKLECDNFDLVEEILIRLKFNYKDLKIKEVPIYFNKRMYGESKRDLVAFAFSYINTIIKLYKIKRQEVTKH